MSWFFRKKSNPDSPVESITNEMRSLAFSTIEQRRIYIIYAALFDCDDALMTLFNKTSFVAEKLKSKSSSAVTELLERGLRETSFDFCSDTSKDLLKTLIQNSTEKISQGCPRWLEERKNSSWNQFSLSQFEEYTTIAFLMKKFYSIDEHIMFSNPNYFKTEFDKLKDFRLKTLVESCMTLVELKSGGRFTGVDFEDAAFKATPISHFIESCWHIHIKRFGEFAVLRTMMDDDNNVLSRICRSEAYSVHSGSSICSG